MVRAAAALLACTLCLAGCQNPARRALERADDLAFHSQPKAALAEVTKAIRALHGKTDHESQTLRLRALATGGRLCHLFLRRPREALKFYGALVEASPNSDLAFDARQRMAEIRIEDLGDRAGAIAQYQALVAGFPHRAGVDKFQYEIAEGYFHLADYAQTRTEAHHLIKRYPDSKWVDDALFLIGQAWHAQMNLKKALEAFDELEQRFPGTPLAARADVEEGNCLEEQGHDEKALDAYIAALPKHPDPELVQLKIHRLRARMAAAGVGGTKADLRPKE